MNYSKEQIKDLINYLKNYKDTFKVLIDFFEDHYNKGHFDLGLNVPGNQNAAVIIKEMEYLFPDILYTMFLSEKDLPLFVNNGICNLHEHIIASWRLKQFRKKL